MWIPIATECYIKWVEIMSRKRANSAVVANFTKDDIICWFGVPKCLLFDNGTSLVIMHMWELLNAYGIDHRKSSPFIFKGMVKRKPQTYTVSCTQQNGFQWAQEIVWHSTRHFRPMASVHLFFGKPLILNLWLALNCITPRNSWIFFLCLAGHQSRASLAPLRERNEHTLTFLEVNWSRP